MKAQTKRLVAALLFICMLASMVPVISLAAETEAETKVVTYDFSAEASGLTVGDDAIADVTVKEKLNAAYAEEKLNWTLLASKTTGSLKQDKVDTAETGVAYEGLTAKTSIPGWIALKLKNPGAGTYSVDLSYYETKFGAAESVAYLLPGSAVTAATEEEIVTQVDTLIASASQLGEAINFSGGRSNKVLTVDGWATVELEKSESEYILVFQVKQTYKNATSGSTYMYIDQLSMTALEEEKPEAIEMTYDFSSEASGLTVGDDLIADATLKEKLNAAYAEEKLNWTLLASKTTGSLKQDKVDTAETGVAYEGLTAKTSIPGWIALKLKNPGAGTYSVDLSYYETKFGAAESVAYLLPGSAVTATTEEEIVTQVDSLIASASQLGEAINFSGSRSDKVLTAAGWATVDLEESESEYILVFQVNKTYKNATSGSTYMYIDQLSMKQLVIDTSVSVYDFDLADSETGIYTVPEGAEYVDAKDKLDDIASRYAAGKLNWNYQAICSDIAPDGVLPATTVRMYPQNGMRLYTNYGAWIAFKIKSPGEGIRTLNLTYATSPSGAKATVYILPADTADIDKAIDPSNRVGKVKFHNADGADGFQDGLTTVVGSYRFGTEEEYILVIEATERTPFNDHRAYLHFSQLTITEGYTDKPEEEGTTVNPIMISDAVVNSGDAQNAGMSAEINGVDYYFAPIKGEKMYVYNLNTMEMVDEVDTYINYPNAAVIDENGIVWLGGGSKFLFKYDPYTGIGTKVDSFATGALTSNSGMNDLYYGEDGCLYFGTIKPAHIVKYDPVTRQYTDYGCMDSTANRVSAVAYKNGFIYACVQGENVDNLIKVNAQTGEIVETFDISKYIGDAGYMSKIAFFDDKTLVAGGNRLEKMIALDISGTQMALKDIGVDTGMNNTISEVKDGKFYFVAYLRGLCEYDIATGKAKVIEGLEAANIGFRFTNNTWVTVDHPDLPGESLFTFSATGHVPVFYNLETKKIVRIESLTNGYGAGQIIRGFVCSNDGSNQIFMGAYNTKNATVFDIDTGTFTKYYMTSGQTDSQIIYNGKLYAGNYNPARVTEIDPDTGKATVLINLGLEQFMQDRIHTLTAGDNKIFAGTTPEKYLYSGYLTWYDLETNRIYVAIEPSKAVYAEAADQTKWYDAKTNELCDFDADNDGVNEYQAFKGIIPEQTINCIVYHDGMIYGTSSTCGGTGAVARPDLSAVMFVYDVEKMEVIATYDLCEAINGLVSPIFFVAGIAADPDVATNGKFWGMVSETLFTFTFDKETKTFNVREELSFDKLDYENGAGRQWFPRSFQFKNGYLYVSFYSTGGMRKVNMANPLDNQLIMGDNPLWYVIAEDGNLYYSCNNSELHVLPLDVTDEDWAKAQAVDTLIKAIPSPVTVESEAAIKAAREAYNALSWAHRALVQNYTALEEAESDLTEAKIDTIGEVTLEDAALIGTIRAEYEELTSKQKEYVKNYDTLLAAENALADLQTAADKAAVDNVEKLIAAIGEVTKDSGDAIKAARNAYDALTDAQKEQVTSLKVLEDAEAAYEEATRDPSNPGTGDFAPVMLLACVALISAMAIVAVPVIRKKV